MTQQLITTTPANSGLGDSPKAAFDKANANFTDLYTQLTTLNNSVVQPSAFTAFGNPNAFPLNSGLSFQLKWATAVPSTPGGGGLNGISSGGTAPGWTATGSTTGQNFNGAGANLAATVQLGIFTSSAAANSTAEHIATLFNATIPSAYPCVRILSNGLPVAGFTMALYFVFTTVIANEQVFFGFCPGTAGLGGSQVPSALLNMIGLGRDTADTNLQFMINNGAGTASKTDLGVTLASLANKLLRLVITCDGVGNCSIVLSNMESGGSQFTANYPAATAKLPAANVLVEPHWHINNGGTAASVAYGVSSGYITVGLTA